MENKMKRQHILNHSFKGENNVKNFPVLMKETNPWIQEVCTPISEPTEKIRKKRQSTTEE